MVTNGLKIKYVKTTTDLYIGNCSLDVKIIDLVDNKKNNLILIAVIQKLLKLKLMRTIKIYY